MIQEREYVRHVRILTFPVGRLYLVFLVTDLLRILKYPPGQPFVMGFLILAVFGEEFIAVLVKRLLVVVYEKEDTDCKKVGYGCLEKLVGIATGSLLSLLKGLNKCLRCFLCCSQICNVLLLDRIDACAVLNINKVNDIEITVFWQVTLHLIFPIVIIELSRKCRELVVIDNYRKALGRMLTDIRLYDRECLTGTGRADNPCTSEWIDNIDSTPPELALIVVTHRDIGNTHLKWSLLAHLSWPCCDRAKWPYRII